MVESSARGARPRYRELAVHSGRTGVVVCQRSGDRYRGAAADPAGRAGRPAVPVLGAPWSVRNAVIEYGGRPYLVRDGHRPGPVRGRYRL